MCTCAVRDETGGDVACLVLVLRTQHTTAPVVTDVRAGGCRSHHHQLAGIRLKVEPQLRLQAGPKVKAFGSLNTSAGHADVVMFSDQRERRQASCGVCAHGCSGNDLVQSYTFFLLQKKCLHFLLRI